jgi:four helix bundle protein
MRPAARTFRDLLVWQKAHAFVLGVYTLTAAFPKHEIYSLSIQMRRAAVSIPANIAEGFRKRGKVDKVRYMNIAEGSLEESRYYLILAQDLGFFLEKPVKGIAGVALVSRRILGLDRSFPESRLHAGGRVASHGYARREKGAVVGLVLEGYPHRNRLQALESRRRLEVRALLAAVKLRVAFRTVPGEIDFWR